VTVHAEGVLDTSIIVALSRYDPAELPETFLITAITLGELSYGPHATDDPLKRAARVAVLQHVEATFEPLPYDHHAARFYGQICAAVRASGSLGRHVPGRCRRRRSARVDGTPGGIDRFRRGAVHTRISIGGECFTGTAVVWDSVVGRAVDLQHRSRPRPRAVCQQSARDGSDRSKGIGLASQSKRHHRPVRHTGDVDTGTIDRDLLLDGADHGGDESDVVDVVALRFTTARAGIPGAVETVGVSDQEMATIGRAVPVIGVLGLCTVTKAAMQHHHQWDRIGQTLRPVQMKGPAGPARLDGLGGLPDRDRPGTGRS